MLRIEVTEPDKFGFEEQPDGAGRAMPLFRDDQLSLVMRQLHVALPFLHGLAEFLRIVERTKIGALAAYAVVYDGAETVYDSGDERCTGWMTNEHRPELD